MNDERARGTGRERGEERRKMCTREREKGCFVAPAINESREQLTEEHRLH